MGYAIHPHERNLAHFLAMTAGGHRRGRGRGRGYGRHGGPPFGMPGFPGPRGRRAKRGDIRTALLVLLAEEPRNGYGLMQEIEARSDGAWKPSPGSVYPALQQLEDEGLVRREERDGQRQFHLTDDGRAYVAERGEDEAPPWETAAEGVDDAQWKLQEEFRQLSMAIAQLLQGGSDAQRETASEKLAETRRAVYGILADEDPS